MCTGGNGSGEGNPGQASSPFGGQTEGNIGDQPSGMVGISSPGAAPGAGVDGGGPIIVAPGGTFNLNTAPAETAPAILQPTTTPQKTNTGTTGLGGGQTRTRSARTALNTGLADTTKKTLLGS